MLVKDMLVHKLWPLEHFLADLALVFIPTFEFLGFFLGVLQLHFLQNFILFWVLEFYWTFEGLLLYNLQILVLEVFAVIILATIWVIVLLSKNFLGVSHMLRPTLVGQHSFIIILCATVKAIGMHSSQV